jgi:hypothetical protein
VNKKTLLDEFAMAALTGWVSTLEPDATVNCETVAASLYDLAGAMIAERAKRMPAAEQDQQTEPTHLLFDGVKWYAQRMAGSRATCAQVYRSATGRTGTPQQSELLQVGRILRGLGYKRCRSGGKDYYQL